MHRLLVRECSLWQTGQNVDTHDPSLVCVQKFKTWHSVFDISKGKSTLNKSAQELVVLSIGAPIMMFTTSCQKAKHLLWPMSEAIVL